MDLSVEHIKKLFDEDSLFRHYHEAFESATDKHSMRLEDQIAWEFLKRVRRIDADLASDYDITSFVQRDRLLSYLPEFLIQHGSEKTGVRSRTFAVTLKRAFIEIWLRQNHTTYQSPEFAEHRRLFSAFVVISDPMWIRQEQFLAMHMGSTDWDNRLEEHLTRFAQIDLLSTT